MLSLRELLELWDLKEHPFESYTAEQEPRLHEYFVQPPYLDDVIGSVENPTPVLVFGARGIGKSAIRIFIENLALKADSILADNAIAVTYDDFTVPLRDGLDKVSLEGHLRGLLRKMVFAALARFAQVHKNRFGVQKPTEESIRTVFPDLDIQILARLVDHHFSRLTDIQREDAIKGTYDYLQREAMTLEDRANWFIRLWSHIRVPLVDVANLLLAGRGKDPIQATSLPASDTKEVDATETLMADLRAIAGLASQLHIKSWLVLVDKVDETETTDSDATSSAALISPLVKNLRLLETPQIGFKFFLWDQLRSVLKDEGVRLDKIRNWRVAWTEDELHHMIDERLRAYSGGKLASLEQLCDENTGDIYQEVLHHSMSSPREIVQVLDAIFREHARHSTHDNGATITRNSLDKGIDEYCKRRVSDLYPADTIRSLTKLTNTRFTSHTVQALFKISQPAASTKIRKWVKDGYVEQVESLRSGNTGKPVNQYQVAEARIGRLIERKLQ